MYEQDSIFNNIKRAINTDRLITRLILANVIAFILLNIVAVVAWIATQRRDSATHVIDLILGWVKMSPDPKMLLFHPWTLVTHIFVHYQFMHLLSNMVGLYFVGKGLNDTIGPKKTLPLFFYGGIIGGLFFVLSANLMPAQWNPESTAIIPEGAIGASAAIFAMLVALATTIPNQIVRVLFFEAKLKHVATGFILLSLIPLAFSFQNVSGHIAHLGGALFGFVYIRQMKVGHDWSVPFNNLVLYLRSLRIGRRKYPHLAYKRDTSYAIGNQFVQAPINTKDKQARIDAILDKINQSGYDSLSKAEKEFLFRSSKED